MPTALKSLTKNIKKLRKQKTTFARNKLHIKKPPSKLCKCGKKIRRRSTKCSRCHMAEYQLDNKTLIEATGHRKGPHKYINIRKAARRIYLNTNKPRQCLICGYKTHFEVAHIKSIPSFNQTSLISQINYPANLAALCPNHHWELDHGLLKLALVGFEPTTSGL